MNKEYSPKILVTTGAGNTIKGGADIWTNHFLKWVWPTLPDKKEWFLLIDSKRPAQFEERYLPKGLRYHFHGDDPEVTKDWLNRASVIHFLHSHYHKRPHIWHFEDKFGTIFVHAYPRDMISVIDKIPELKLLQFNTKVDAEWYDDFLLTFNRRIWIGCNPSQMFDNFPNYSYNVPNFYEFQLNAPLTNHVNNGKVGYAARIETRKAFHWMHGVEGLALVEQMDLENLRATTTYTFPKLDVYQYHPDIHQHFMNKNWGIFHGAHFQEPFGYNIFQAVDYGKLPIINHDWCPEVEYKYRASTMNDFQRMIKQILKDSHQEREENWLRLKQYMKRFDNREEWVDKVRTAILA
jgi:hypothetical protein